MFQLTLKVKFSDFQLITLSRTLDQPTQLDTEILDTLRDLAQDARDRRRARVRLVGVSLARLTFNQGQMTLFPKPNRDKWERVMTAVDTVRDKYEFHLLRTARSMFSGPHTRPLTPALAK